MARRLCVVGVLGALACAIVAWGAVPAAEPAVEAKDLPRVPPTQADKALATLKVKKGFKVELVACEPDVVDPIAMCFDERGRMFVVEMRDYSERRDERLGRIKVLEDTDGDGRMDKAGVFAKDLPWPTGLLWANGGLYVVSSPELMFFKDANDDGVADEKTVLFTGFGEGMSRLNVQALPNSLTWGLDNRIHGATGPNGGVIKRVGGGEKGIDLRGKDFSFDPKKLDLRAENGGGQYGLSFDDTGRKFVCSNSHHIQACAYDIRYAGKNPHYSLSNPLMDIAVDGPAAEVFRLSPEEPWRVIRTKWRVAGLVKGPIEGGGRSAGYFTGATGITIYRGDALGAEFRNNAFIGDAGGNLLHRKVVTYPAALPVAQRPGDERTLEFLASTDNWFRPVQGANGPDGCLYLMDMYREVIEHPWSLPESIKKHLDLNSGNDRGRIYRIAPENFERRGRADLGAKSSAELVKVLEHSNGWHRETAGRLLFERGDRVVVPELVKLLEESKSALGRLHALYALRGLEALTEEDVRAAMSDADAAVRRNAVQLAEDFFKEGVPSDRMWVEFREAMEDADATVRYQLSWTLSLVRHPQKSSMLGTIARSAKNDRWFGAAILNAAGDCAGSLFHDLRTAPTVDSLVVELAAMARARNQKEEIHLIRDHALRMRHDGIGFDVARALRNAEAIEKLTPEAIQLASSNRGFASTRQRAIRFLAVASKEKATPLLLSLLDDREGQPVQLAALGALDESSPAGLAKELLKWLPRFLPRIRAEAIAVMLKRPERAMVLLKAIEEGKVRASEIPSTQAQVLRTHHVAAVRELAGKVLAATTGTRQEVVEKFMPAVEMAGDAVQGKQIFMERCVSCHRIGQDGHALGPDLMSVRSAGKQTLLANILDPNREVNPQYIAYVIDTKDGETLVGMVVHETPEAVTLGQAYGMKLVVPRKEIARLRSQNQSLMPENLEEGLSAQDVANLLELISTAQP